MPAGSCFYTPIGMMICIALISGCSPTAKSGGPSEATRTAAPASVLTDTPLPPPEPSKPPQSPLVTLPTLPNTPTPASSTPPPEPSPRDALAGWQVYHNLNYGFSLFYPGDWIVQQESYHSVTLVPRAEASWQPATPADIPKNPAVVVDAGEYIREKLGSAYFPETIDYVQLKQWLEQQVNNQEAVDLVERSINNVPAFNITRVGMSGCEQVTYWRPTDLQSLVRIATGCESAYLDDVGHIVKSIQHSQ